MKPVSFCILSLVLFCTSCSKNPIEYLVPKPNPTTSPNKPTLNSHKIIGKWWLGKYERCSEVFCVIEENNDGDYVEFRNNDTVYYTYADGSLGWSPYKIIDKNLIVFNGLVNTITWHDGNFTLYNEETTTIKNWQTFLKFE